MFLAEVVIWALSMYMFFCFLYFMFRPSTAGATAEASKIKKKAQEVAGLATNVGAAGSIAGVVLGQMQMITVIWSAIDWSPDLPPWLQELLGYLGDMFMLNISFSSPDCISDTSMDPLNKWLVSLMTSWLLLAAFVIWYLFAKWHFKRTEYSADVVQTILRSAVNVLLIGMCTFLYYSIDSYFFFCLSFSNL